MGKMISLASIAVACAATGLTSEDEARLFRFTFKHSIFLACVVGIVVDAVRARVSWARAGATAEKVSRAFRAPCPPGLPTRTTTLGSTRSRRAAVEILDRLAENLVMFIRQDRGTLSKNRRDVEFRTLLNDEVVVLITEGIVRDAFEDFNDHGRQLDF